MSRHPSDPSADVRSDAAPAGACLPGAHHCVTCSDEAVPMRVMGEEDDGLVVCEDEAGRRVQVLTGIVGAVEPGERLLVHAGAALRKLPPEMEASA